MSKEQECIPVGCVPADRWPYCGVCSPGGGYLVPGGCTWSREVNLVWGDVPGPRGCTWPRGVYLVWGVGWGVPGLGGVSGPGGYLVLGDVPGPRGVYLVPGGCTWSQGGTWSRGVYLVPRGVYLVRYSPPSVNRMTNRCKNITLAKTSFRPVNMFFKVQSCNCLEHDGGNSLQT